MLNRHAQSLKPTMSITGEGIGEESGRGRFGTTNKDSESRRSDRKRGGKHGGGPAENEHAKRCNYVVMLKTKRIQCVQIIKAQAIATGVADIARLWREFQSSTDARYG